MPVIYARRETTCRACREPIREGDRIARPDGESGPWVHAVECCGEYYGEEPVWGDEQDD